MNKCYVTIVFAALVTGLGATAEAAVLATMQEVGNDIVVFGGGEVNLAGLTAGSSESVTAGMTPSTPSIGFGANPSSGHLVDRYTGVTPPSTFGAGTGVGADTGSGDRFVRFPTQLRVPLGYVSNASLVFSNTYLNSSFASLGITPGTYDWTWGNGANADSFTLNIVPEPASLAVWGLLGGLALLRRSRWARAGHVSKSTIHSQTSRRA